MMRVTKWLFSVWCLWACVVTALADEDMPYIRTQEVSADITNTKTDVCL